MDRTDRIDPFPRSARRVPLLVALALVLPALFATGCVVTVSSDGYLSSAGWWYYPGTSVYYSPGAKVWYYHENGVWVRAYRLPQRYRAKLHAGGHVSIRYSGPRPYVRYHVHRDRYRTVHYHERRR